MNILEKLITYLVVTNAFRLNSGQESGMRFDELFQRLHFGHLLLKFSPTNFDDLGDDVVLKMAKKIRHLHDQPIHLMKDKFGFYKTAV